MAKSDIKSALYNRTAKSEKGYALGKGDNKSWFNALEELKKSKRVVIRSGKAYVTNKAASKG